VPLWRSGRTPTGRRVSSLVLLGLIVILSLTAAAAQASTFGTRALSSAYYNEKRGGSVSIKAPALSQNTASDEIVLHRSVTQSGYGDSPGLVQGGIYRSGAGTHLDNCASRGSWVKFIEYKKQGTPNAVSSYHCHLYGAVDSGSDPKVTVYRRNDAERWGIQFNSNNVGAFETNFGTGYPAIGGEINGGSPFTSATTVRYGDQNPWKVFNDTGADNAFQPSDNTKTAKYIPNGGWTVGQVPTPLTVSY
jgi:hypothetical protein